MSRRDLPESFYTTPLVERLKAIAGIPIGSTMEDQPEWLSVGAWGQAINETCREAAAALDGIAELAEATKRNTELLELLKERVILGGGIGHIHEDELAKLTPEASESPEIGVQRAIHALIQGIGPFKRED